LPLKTVQLDVTDDISVKNAIQSITAESSRIDVLVNNAGYAVAGAFEDLSMEEIKAQYETNLFGIIRVTHHEKTEVWYNCKHEFRTGTIWYSCTICLRKHKIWN
jgi:NAD(P)-dependent dehydrogenase (short-subunit alcohol dehydrogenase family)